MYELVQHAQNSHFNEIPAKVGLVALGAANVCLIDSGNDKDAGRKVRQLLDAKGWHLKTIFNTHFNADHISGNQYLQKQTGCSVRSYFSWPKDNGSISARFENKLLLWEHSL